MKKGYNVREPPRVAQKDARIDWALGQMNDGNTLSDNTTVLREWFLLRREICINRPRTQAQDFWTQIIHFGKHSDGQILTHGVMKDSARAIFNGISKIEHGATNQTAYRLNVY
ncbi:SufD family Fe-S cluster assembly protein [Sinobaca sp. H24]|uniref:SufD family Fe-S cluster assembly protein n=1 Tax=Sinobaca sp. H24 TaxID=2923376 RepID=UPI0035B2E957